MIMASNMFDVLRAFERFGRDGSRDDIHPLTETHETVIDTSKALSNGAERGYLERVGKTDPEGKVRPQTIYRLTDKGRKFLRSKEVVAVQPRENRPEAAALEQDADGPSALPGQPRPEATPDPAADGKQPSTPVNGIQPEPVPGPECDLRQPWREPKRECSSLTEALHEMVRPVIDPDDLELVCGTLGELSEWLDGQSSADLIRSAALDLRLAARMLRTVTGHE